MRRRQDNRGSSLIVVIIVIAFVSLLVATLFMMTVINIQMKSVDREVKENFYSAEGALEQITLGLQMELSEVSTDAYASVMQQYGGNTMEVERREIFNNKLIAGLEKRLTNVEHGGVAGKYDIAVLESYLTEEVADHTVINSTKDRQLVPDPVTGSLVLKGLEVSYTDDQGLLTVIETDIRLTAPNLNLVQPSDMPDVFDYTIVANDQLIGDLSGTVNIEAGVYAGVNGLTLSSGAVWDFKQAHRLVVEGQVNIPREASLSTTGDMDLWAKELNVMGGTLTSRGRTYVSNDLVMSDEGSEVTLEGEYYGYGSGEMLTDAGIMLSAGGDSSAILINGVNSTLDMSNMRRLLLSGSAQIATGQVTFDSNQVTGYLPKNDPGLDEKKERAYIAAASYYMHSMGNGLMVSSQGDYVRAVTHADYQVQENSWERFLLINNDDGTFSFLDPNNHKNQYVSVKTDNQNMLIADSDECDVNEKFYLYVITEGDTNYYAFKSYANGKFVSVDTYYDANGNPVSGVLCANRDKITDDAQLFLLTYWDELPEKGVWMDRIPPTPVFKYIDESTLKVQFGFHEWGVPFGPGTASWLQYTVTRNGVELDSPKMGDTHMNFVFGGSGPTDKWHLDWTITDLQVGDIVNFDMRYTDDMVNGNISYIYDGVYIHRPGNGNTAVGDSDKVQFADGLYAWRWNPTTGSAKYCTSVDGGTQPLQFSKDSATTTTTSADLFHLVNNHDGTVSIMANDNRKYVTVQRDGTLIPEGDIIDVNAKFTVKFVNSGGAGHYQLWTLKESVVGSEMCVCVNTEGSHLLYVKAGSRIEEGEDRFDFEFWAATSEIGTRPEPVIPPPPPNYNPVAGVVYKDEDEALASFTSPYWEDNGVGTVKMTYSIGVSPTYPEIPVTMSGTKATWTIPNLQHLDKVIYRFEYTYTDNSGVTHRVTTPDYIYIHERLYGDEVPVDGTNVNIDLGESIEVKSNQIAYLVPPECIGVYEGETIVGKNPMSSEDFGYLMTLAKDTVRYPGFEMVSFTKEVEGLGKSLGEYRTEGTDGYETVFVQSPDGTMVYFYVDFDSDNTSAYFRDYYEKNQSILEGYMKSYVNEIKLSNRFTRLTTHGNMVYSPNGSTGRIDLRSNEGYGANLGPVELSGLRNEEFGYQKRFKALSTKLMLDYDDLTMAEKSRNLFDNLIRFSEVEGDADGQAFAGVLSGTTPLSYTVDNATAHVIHNMGLDAYHYNSSSDPDKKVCLIIATGDVVVEQDFSGVIIARGTVTIDNSSVNTITGNQEALYKVLKYKMDAGDPNSETLLEHYFRDGNKYVLDDGTEAVVINGDYVSYADLVTYEEWTKR